MADSEQKDYRENSESDPDTCDSYDSEDDPSFDILEETQSSFSKLSIKKKSKSRISKDMDEETEEDPELVVPDLDEKDQKSFETVQKIIEVGQVDKLKVDQCKVYLRKNGLRLTGNKDTLIGRIKEHLDIVNGGGETKYPASSFIVNCKGDACTGDVVMFEQNVYEMFNIASRSATGPPCGTRVVAGRIVKESYGAAKQQHTFTIEVLWSKGEKPLPSLHPLLIKGRNLYKLKTMRQRWQDEGMRQKNLLEKHTRGSVARMNRDTRIQEKEMRKMLKANRVSRTQYQSQKVGENTSKTIPSIPIISQKPKRQAHEQQDLHPTFQSLPTNLGKELQPKMQKTSHQENARQNCKASAPTYGGNSLLPNANVHGGNSFSPNGNEPSENILPRQPLAIMNQNYHRYEQSFNSNPSLRAHTQEQKMNSNWFTGQICQENSNRWRSPIRNHGQQESTNSTLRRPFRRQINEQKQVCRYYAQGRCYYGDQCKYLHENPSYGQMKNERWPPSDLSYHYKHRQ